MQDGFSVPSFFSFNDVNFVASSRACAVYCGME
jgi:hypothetical protein